MSTDLSATEPFDMLSQPRQQFRLTPEEFESASVAPIQIERREAIRDLAAALFAAKLDGTGLERVTQGHPMAATKIHFSGGIYTREIRLPAGLRVVGMRHRQEHINIVSEGRATVMTEHGKQEIVGPCSFVSPAGTQRFLLVHEDMIWTTIHRTDKTDPDEAFADVFIDELPLISARIERLKLERTE